MEEIRARSKNHKPATPDQPTMTWTWGVGVGVGCGQESKSYSRDERRDDGDLRASRVSQGRDMKEQGARGRQQAG